MAEIRDQVKNALDTGADKAKQATDRTSEAAHNFMDTAKETVESAANRVSEFAGRAEKKVANWAGDAASAVNDTAKSAGQRAEHAYDMTADTVSDFGKEIATMIRKYPLPTLLVGFGIGMLVGRSVSKA